ncbi:Helix-turn-helix domain protein [Candidatus Bilamarchaeum dharawalense]|uniref:Helix-turn-helix domain protein n=1 Tax=Candidatus Bilamarchaeum dharawalense TaxID=2885759 RepID=A0A5E4LW37_9ARCH|nr:Helix-turn-helix domain protein [Candidatus Bilamarchaeum dharawalense]
MPRGKKIIIETEVNDDFVDRFRSINLDDIKKDRESTEDSLSSSVASVFKVAQNLYRQKASEDELEGKHKLFSVRSAYDFLKDNGVFISFRAFGGRIERGTIPFVKVGRKRYIPISVLEDITKTKSDFYTVKEAFEEYKKANQKINFRAFIGRIEKGSIPSVKFGTRRLVPRDAVESLTHISSNYYTVSQAIKELYKGGIRIKRNAFERRLDRGRIPHVKIGGRRFIHEDVMKELVDKEVALKK